MAEEAAVGPEPRGAPRLEPSPLAIGGPGPHLVVERPSFGDGREEVVDVPRPVVGVRQQLPPVARQLVPGRPEVPEERVVDELLASGGVVRPDDQGELIREGPELLGVPTQLRFGQVAGRVVLEHDGESPLGLDRHAEHVEPTPHGVGPLLEPDGFPTQSDARVAVDPMRFEIGHQLLGGPTDGVGQTRHLLEERIGVEESVVDRSTLGVHDHLAEGKSLVDRVEERAESVGAARGPRPADVGSVVHGQR